MEAATHRLQSDIMAASLVQMREKGWGGYTVQSVETVRNLLTERTEGR